MTETNRSNRIDWDLLGLYMADHVTGATAGIGRLRRMAKTFANDEHGPALASMVRDLESERQLYYDLMDRFGLPRRGVRQALAWAAEKAGRLKLNGYLLTTSPSTPVLEAELMRSAVIGKLGGWQTLREYADELQVPPSRFDELIAKAEQQIEQLSALHESARRTAFLADTESAIESD